MTSSWLEIKQTIKSDLLSRDLANPQIRLRALDGLEKLLVKVVPKFLENPKALMDIGRSEVARQLAQLKSNGRLNGAERSVLKNVFDALSGTLPNAPARRRHRPRQPQASQPASQESRTQKLAPLAEVVAQLLEQEFAIPARYYFEQELEWLDVLPTRSAVGDFWDDVCRVYASLVDNQFSVSERLSAYASALRSGPQRFDVWFDAPYNFALEFDEDQHFNQYRLRTLRQSSIYSNLPVDLAGYMRQCSTTVARPGTTGFARLKTVDPLFPPTLPGEKQDNRVRQRAFRDFLKDVIPLARPSCNPTWRVGSYVLGGKRKDFGVVDCQRVAAHVRELGFLGHVAIG